jgi:hypothetical protein
MAVVMFTCCVAAIRFKGKILLVWAITISTYNLRPHYYVFNKNEPHLRESSSKEELVNSKELVNLKHSDNDNPRPRLVLSDEDVFRLNSVLNNPNLSLSFMQHKKAGLRVYISEIE